MITEEQIEKLLDAFEKNTISELEVDQCIKTNDAYFQLLADDCEVLFDEERDYLFELAVFYCLICKAEINDIEAYQKTEESNWEFLHTQKSVKHSFNYLESHQYSETELIAYLEDAIFIEESEEDNFLTGTGIEFIFIKIKSIIDHSLNTSITQQ